MYHDGATVLETDRLRLRPLTEADVPALRAMLQDAVTMIAYNGPFSDDEVVAWLARQRENYRQCGHGLWAVVLRASGDVIGQCGLTYQIIDETTVLEVGYMFNRAHWHRGYATEAARACRDKAFDDHLADTVHAQIRDSNIASMNVAIRLGMTIRGRFVKHYRGVDMPHYDFAITADAARGGQPR